MMRMKKYDYILDTAAQDIRYIHSKIHTHTHTHTHKHTILPTESVTRKENFDRMDHRKMNAVISHLS